MKLDRIVSATGALTMHIPAGNVAVPPMDDACWVWIPGDPGTDPVVADFWLEIDHDGTPIVFSITADQRFELHIDEEWVASGPDAGPVWNWPYATYRLELSPGRHQFRARVWWLGAHAPLARMTHRGGFLLVAEEPHRDRLSTGRAPWQVTRLGGWSFEKPAVWHYVAVGDQVRWDGIGAEQMCAAPRNAEVIAPAVEVNPWGVLAKGWHPVPSPLPEQLRRRLRPGRIRAVRSEWMEDGMAYEPADELDPRRAAWESALKGAGEVRVPPHSGVTVLWDLEDYYCGWPVVEVVGGRDAVVEVGWCESLYERPPRVKGNRDQVVGKTFYGMADRYRLDGDRRCLRPLWWRAGRYVQLRLRTGEDPLVVESLSWWETRYPLESESLWECDDPELQAVDRICVRALQMCAHEHFVDCPHYEQMMYVGDTRVESLVTHVLTRDARLVRRAIELFDLSRASTFGWVGARFPTREPQIIPAFALIWVGMLRDHLLWRGDDDFIRGFLPSVRGLLSEVERYADSGGVLGSLPGWPYADWVEEWPHGNAPGASEGPSALINLFYLMALQDAAFLERIVGDPVRERFYRRHARAIRTAILDRFWDSVAHLMADESRRGGHCEHVQVLAYLGGALPPGAAPRVVRALLEGRCRPRVTLYFSHYLFEALARAGRGETILQRLRPWREMLHRGLRTTMEKPELTRSDCHAWSAHPAFHFRASIAGIRPAAPGFAKVQVRPELGGLGHVRVRLPHPMGWIEMELERGAGEALHGEVRLPDRVDGCFCWRRKTLPLQPGSNAIRLSS